MFERMWDKGILVFSFLFFINPLSAEEKKAPKEIEKDQVPSVIMTAGNANKFLGIVEYILEIAEKPGSYRNFDKNVVESFGDGVNFDRTVAIQSYVIQNAFRTLIVVPLKAGSEGFREFRGGLKEGKVRTLPDGMFKDLWQTKGLEGDADGFFQHLRKLNLAIIGSQKDVRNADPIPEDRLKLESDLAVSLDNSTTSADARKKAFAQTQKDYIKDMEKWKGEPRHLFKLRKDVTADAFGVIGESYVDAAKATLSVTVDKKKHHGSFEGSITASPNTELAKNMEKLDKIPQRFGSIQKDANALQYFSLAYPLTPAQKTFLRTDATYNRKLFDYYKKNLKTESAKIYQKDFGELSAQILEDLADLGYINTVTKTTVVDKSQKTLATIGALQLKKKNLVSEFLKAQLKAGRAKHYAKLNVDMMGDIAIHEILVPKELAKSFDTVLGADPTTYIAEVGHALWLSSGTDALDRLRQALTLNKSYQPTTSALAIDLSLTLLPLTIAGNRQLTINKLFKKHKQRALRTEILSRMRKGSSRFRFQMKKTGDLTASLRADASEGVLRAIGVIAAYYIDDSLD